MKSRIFITTLCSRRFVIGGLLVKAIISELYPIILFLRHHQLHCCKHITQFEIQVLLLPDYDVNNPTFDLWRYYSTILWDDCLSPKKWMSSFVKNFFSNYSFLLSFGDLVFFFTCTFLLSCSAEQATDCKSAGAGVTALYKIAEGFINPPCLKNTTEVES